MLDLQDVEFESAVNVKGRLKENIAFWKKVGACDWVLKVLERGYYLPFKSIPEKRVFKNQASTSENYEFVCTEIRKLVASSALVEVSLEDLTVVNPLGVVQNANGKLRLILDLRHVNNCLRSCRFKYEGIQTATELFQSEDWVFKFDYKSGYHHVDIFEPHTTFLGCALVVAGKMRYFKYTVLPFGLSTGPYVFTRIQKTLVKYWRSKGYRIFTYLDDGAGAEQDYRSAHVMAERVKMDIQSSGFVINKDKSQWIPAQSVELLGFVMDLKEGKFRVPTHRMDALRRLIDTVIKDNYFVSARMLARVAGSLVSMMLAMGPVVRLWTRAIYTDICQALSWDRRIALSLRSRTEVQFWKENLDTTGYPVWTPSPKIEVITYSDASGQGWGGFSVNINGAAAVGSWSEDEKVKSSTFRELRAIRLVLESYGKDLQGKEVCHRTDNKNAETIMSVGSRVPELQLEAVAVYKLCRELNIRLSVEWLSRDDNVEADELSRIEDTNDYMLDPNCFKLIDKRWGPHTIDRFASIKTRQLERYCSLFRNPGCEGVNAFTLDWAQENNWIFPPPVLVPRVIRHMSVGKEDGTLIVPQWSSAVWWPLLINKAGSWNSFIKNTIRIKPYKGIFVSGSAASNIFTSDVPSFAVLALRICFSEQ